MKLLLLLPLLLSSCYAAPAYAGVFPGVWDGKCIPVTTKYQHDKVGGETTVWRVDTQFYHPFDYAKGFIPPDKSPDDSDISACFPKIDSSVKGPQ